MNSIYRFITCFVFILYSFCSYGQIKTNASKSEIDSLINIIPNFEGSELVDHLNLIATSISQRYPDSCLHYANQASELADSLNYEFGKAEAIFNKGNGYFYKIDLKNSLTNYLTALRIFETFGDTDELGNLLLQIGFINTFVGNNEKSIKYGKRAQSIFKNTGNKYAELFVKYGIANAFRLMNEKDSALYYLNKILPECRQLGNKRYEAWVLNVIGLTLVLEDGMKALPYYEKSLKIMREIGDSYAIAKRLGNIGTLYMRYLSEPDFEKAETYLLESMHESEKIGDSIYVAWQTSYLGELYKSHGKIKKAKYILNKGLKIVKNIDVSTNTMMGEYPDSKLRYSVSAKKTITWIYAYLEWVFEAEGDYKKAHYYNKLKVQAEDSIFSEANRRLTEVILANAENESYIQKMQLLEKEKELQEERARRSIIFLIGSGVLIILVVLVAILFIRQKKSRIEQEKTNLQQKLLRSQMNPHFLFNSLSSIQNFIIKEKPILASDYLGRFSKLVRQVLNNSVEEWIILEDEFGSIENYLELQKARHRDMFDYTIEIDKKIDPETILVPPMLAQPFIENSIEHGFKNKEEKGRLQIRFHLNGSLIRFEVEDNGVGREKARKILQKQNKDHQSMATNITRERLQVLNKKLKQKISLTIIDLKDDKGDPVGTKVTFDIPYKN